MNAFRRKKDGAGKKLNASEVVRVAAKAAYYGGSGLLLIIMALVTIDVIGRALLNKPLVGVLEISEFFLAGAVLLGLAHTEYLGGHVMVELLYDRLSPQRQNILRIFYSLVGIGLYGVIAWQSGRLAIELMKANLTSDVLKIPAWPFRAFVPVGAFLVVLVLLVKLSRDFRDLRERRTNKCR